MSFGEDESKVKRWALFNTNSAINFNNGVVTYTLSQIKLISVQENMHYI